MHSGIGCPKRKPPDKTRRRYPPGLPPHRLQRLQQQARLPIEPWERHERLPGSPVAPPLVCDPGPIPGIDPGNLAFPPLPISKFPRQLVMDHMKKKRNGQSTIHGPIQSSFPAPDAGHPWQRGGSGVVARAGEGPSMEICPGKRLCCSCTLVLSATVACQLDRNCLGP